MARGNKLTTRLRSQYDALAYALNNTLGNALANTLAAGIKVDNAALLMLSFAGGVSATLWQSSLFAQQQFYLLAALVLCFAWAIIRLRQQNKPSSAHLWLVSLLFLSMGILAGLLWANLHFQQHSQRILSSAWQGQSMLVSGNINSLPERKNGNIRFTFIVTESDEKSLLNQHVRLSCYRCPWDLETGQTWQFTVRLKTPRGYASWGAFDYEKYLFRHRVVATGYVRSRENNQLIRSQFKFFNQQRAAVKDYFAPLARANDGEFAVGVAMLQALTIGDKSLLTHSQRQVFQATGVSHLMAISGLHVGLVFVFMTGVVGFLLWPVARIFEYYPKQLIVLLPALAAAIYYAGLAGFSIPTQRAVLMLSIFVLAKLIARHSSLLRVLLISVFVLLLIDPFSVLDIGFWLSCTAVLIIGLAQNQSKTLENEAKPMSLIKLQPIIWLGMLPFSVLFFGQVSLVSPVVNLFFVPLFCLLLIPATLLLSLLTVMLNQLAGIALGTQALTYLAMAFSYVFSLLEVIAGFNLIKTSSNELSLISIILAVVCVLAWFFALRWRYWLLLLLGWSVLTKATIDTQGELRIALIDVGQGLAMVIEAADYVLVYDTGPKYRSGFTAADASLIPYLRWRNIDYIDTLIISHGDNDHMGGYQTVTDAFDVGEVLTSRVDKLPNAIACQQGQQWQQGQTEFTIISPDAHTPKGSNNHSCVLKVRHGGVDTLITGDIEKRVERYLINNRQALNADIMLIPHQGSKTSSTAAFLDAVKPKLALVAAGYNNQYGHPHPKVMARYAARGIKVLSTINSGTILLSIDSSNTGQWKVQQYRQTNRRFWHDQKTPI